MSEYARKLFRELLLNNVNLFQTRLDRYNMVEILEEVAELIKPECRGCFEDQPNQEAHMEYGGCMYSYNYLDEKV